MSVPTTLPLGMGHRGGREQATVSVRSRTPLISIEDVSLHYRSPNGRIVEALRNVTLDIPPRSIVSVVGPSGCGKTTLLKLVSRVIKPTSGSVRFEGVPIDNAPIAGRLSYVFQKPLLLPWRTALGNVLLPLEVLKGASARAEVDRARAALELTGLRGFEDSYPIQLSGGMQQRVSLARAIVIHPELLLMDEPFSALDEMTRETLQGELLQIWQRAESATLFITHNVDEAVLLSDRVVVMSSRPGRIIGSIDIDLPRPRTIEARQHVRFFELAQTVREILRRSNGGAGP